MYPDKVSVREDVEAIIDLWLYYWKEGHSRQSTFRKLMVVAGLHKKYSRETIQSIDIILRELGAGYLSRDEGVDLLVEVIEG